MLKLLKEKKGMTLAELMVSLVLLGILGTLSLAALGTYTENYNHINSLNRAHNVADAMFKSIQKQVNNADRIVWENPSEGLTGTVDGGSELYMQMGGYPAYVKQVSAAAPFALGGSTTGKWVSIRYDNATYMAEGGEKISDRELAPSEDSAFGFRVRELKFEKVPASNGYSKAEQMVKVTLTLENAKGIAYTFSQVMECLGNARGLYGNAGELGAKTSSIVVEKRLHTAGGTIYLGGMVKPGQELVYEITVRNEGSTGAKVLLEELPGFLLSDTALFDLPAGGTKTVTATHTVGAGESTVTNSVTARVQDEDGTPLPDVQAHYGPVQVENSGFSVEKRIVAVDGLPVTVNPATVKNGAVITYELLVRNNGNTDLENIMVEDTLTVDGLKEELTSGYPKYKIPKLSAKAAYPQRVTYRVKDGVSGTLVNTVTAYREDKPADTKTASVSTEIESGLDLEVTKKLHDYSITKQDGTSISYEYRGGRITQNPGETLTLNYYIDVTNTGNEPLKKLEVKDFLTVDKSEPDEIASEGMMEQEEIQPNATRTFKATVSFTQERPIPNKLSNLARVSVEGIPGNKEAHCVTLLNDVEGMQITKAILANNGKPVMELGDVAIGSKVVFPVSIKNTGNTALTVKSLRDVLQMEIGKDLVLAGTEPEFFWRADGGEPIQTPFLIERGETLQCYASYTVQDTDGGRKMVNQIQAQTAREPDPLTATSNTVSFVVRVLPPAIGDSRWPKDSDFADHGTGSECYFVEGDIINYISPEGEETYYIATVQVVGNPIMKGDTPAKFVESGQYVQLQKNVGDVTAGQNIVLQRGDVFTWKGVVYVYTNAKGKDLSKVKESDNWNPESPDNEGNGNKFATKATPATEWKWQEGSFSGT